MSAPTKPDTHVLYRFFDAEDTLLYIGITMNPVTRFRAHRADKDWWCEVANIRIETFDDRSALEAAERDAINSEKPKYNVVHNGGKPASVKATPRKGSARMSPIQVGDWIAAGMSDGRCFVGAIAASDETWLSIRQKDFFTGEITPDVAVVRWADVKDMELAYPEDAVRGLFGELMMQDEHLGRFQTSWTDRRGADQ